MKHGESRLLTYNVPEEPIPGGKAAMFDLDGTLTVFHEDILPFLLLRYFFTITL